MKKILKWIDEKAELSLLIIAMMVIACLVMLQVICRYVFNHSLSWPEELATYIHVWYCFLGLSYATSHGLHLRADAFVKIMPPGLRKVLEVVADLALLFFFGYMTYIGIGVIRSMQIQNQLSPALRLPLWIVYLSLLVGSILSVIRLFQKYLRRLTGRTPE